MHLHMLHFSSFSSQLSSVVLPSAGLGREPSMTVHNFLSLSALWVRHFQDVKVKPSCSTGNNGSSNFL
jgi:hypothetical protein